MAKANQVDPAPTGKAPGHVDSVTNDSIMMITTNRVDPFSTGKADSVLVSIDECKSITMVKTNRVDPAQEGKANCVAA